MNNREKVVIKTSIISILSNIVLAGFKAFIGLLANSIAIISDAVNNLSDALSSIITIIGTKLAGRKPNKKHPYGYGRIEYITSLIVYAIVLYAGITALIESIKKIIHPEVSDYSYVTLIILIAGIIVKFILGLYVKKKGKSVNSDALIASGTDAFTDAILSISVLASIGVNVDEQSLESEYHSMVASYLEENQINSPDDLTDLVSQGRNYYRALSSNDLDKRLIPMSETVSSQMVENWSAKDPETAAIFSGRQNTFH